MIVEEYGGRVPDTMEDLLRLPGVGRKTANLVLGDVFKKPSSVVVDTHCIRLTNVWAWWIPESLRRSSSSSGRSCRRRSPRFLPRMVLTAGPCVPARGPKCAECCIRRLCKTGVETLS
jgi:endonuclease-3